jgi:hypothetical protein
MLRASGKLIAIVMATTVVGGASVIGASAGTVAPSSLRGTEHLTVMGSSTNPKRLSVIATGLFTDGGIMPNQSWVGKPATSPIKLARGTIWLRETLVRHVDKLDNATCLETASVRGTYKLIRGTGRYARISGSGRYTATGRLIFGRTANGECATWHPIVDQLILTMSGPALLRH